MRNDKGTIDGNEDEVYSLVHIFPIDFLPKNSCRFNCLFCGQSSICWMKCFLLTSQVHNLISVLAFIIPKEPIVFVLSRFTANL